MKSEDYHRNPVSCASAHMSTCDYLKLWVVSLGLAKRTHQALCWTEEPRGGKGFGKAEGTVQERKDWDFPGGPGVKTLPSNTGSAVPSLMGELRSHMPQSVAKKLK